MPSVPEPAPYGTVASYVEQFRLYDPHFIDSAVAGAVEAALTLAVSDEAFARYARHAFAAASIVRGEHQAARVAQEVAVAEHHERHEPGPLTAPVMATRAYPVGGSSSDDPRFTRSLLNDVAATLQEHGFPPVVAAADKVALAASLFYYLFAAAPADARAEDTNRVARVVGNRGRRGRDVGYAARRTDGTEDSPC